MPDSFFTSSKPRKRKRVEFKDRGNTTGSFIKPSRKGFSTRNARTVAPTKFGGSEKKKAKATDEELSDQGGSEDAGIDDLDLRHDQDIDDVSGEDDDSETPAAKRLRLAKLYLESVKEDLADGEFDAADIDRELISARLKQDIMEHSGKVHLFIADSYRSSLSNPPSNVLRTRGHRFSVTSAVATESGEYLFTSGKEGSIIKWDLLTGKKLSIFHKIRLGSNGNSNSKGKGKASADADIKGHTDEVLTLALSDDGKYLVSAGKDRRLGVWDAETNQWIKGFDGHLGHKDLISALSFRAGTHQLYTGSFDRTLKVYDLSPTVMGYVETLFGHQDHVLSLHALRGNTCVSVGGRDKTVRFWKIVEETQLVFRGGGRSRVREVLEGGLRGDEEGDDIDGELNLQEKESAQKFIEGSIECVAMIDETTFISGGDSGSICLWTIQKKKPIFTQPLAHGFNEVFSETEGLIKTPRWVTSVSTLRYSDIIVSGSWEGCIRLWKLDSKIKSFSLVGTIPAPGVINSLQVLSPPSDFLEKATWMTPQASVSAKTKVTSGTAPTKPSKVGTLLPVLLIAGIGQEHRLGRWLSLKEGVVNGTIVFALIPHMSA